MIQVVFRSVRKITHDYWLLNGPIIYDIGPTRRKRFLLQTCEFWREKSSS